MCAASTGSSPLSLSTFSAFVDWGSKLGRRVAVAAVLVLLLTMSVGPSSASHEECAVLSTVVVDVPENRDAQNCPSELFGFAIKGRPPVKVWLDSNFEQYRVHHSYAFSAGWWLGTTAATHEIAVHVPVDGPHVPVALPAGIGALIVQGVRPLTTYQLMPIAGDSVLAEVVSPLSANETRATVIFDQLDVPLVGDFLLREVESGREVPIHIPVPAEPNADGSVTVSSSSSSVAASSDQESCMREGETWTSPDGETTNHAHHIPKGWLPHYAAMIRYTRTSGGWTSVFCYGLDLEASGSLYDSEPAEFWGSTDDCTIIGTAHTGTSAHIWYRFEDIISYDRARQWFGHLSAAPDRVHGTTNGGQFFLEDVYGEPDADYEPVWDNQVKQMNAASRRQMVLYPPDGTGFVLPMGWEGPFGAAYIPSPITWWTNSVTLAAGAEWVPYTTNVGQFYNFGLSASGGGYWRQVTGYCDGSGPEEPGFGSGIDHLAISMTLHEPTLFIEYDPSTMTVDYLGEPDGSNGGGIQMSSGPWNDALYNLFGVLIDAVTPSQFKIPLNIGKAVVDPWWGRERPAYEVVNHVDVGNARIHGTGIKWLERLDDSSATYGFSAYMSSRFPDSYHTFYLVDAEDAYFEVDEFCATGLGSCPEFVSFYEGETWDLFQRIEIKTYRKGI